MSESTLKVPGRLPPVFRYAIYHLSFFIFACLLTLFAVFYLPFNNLIVFYPAAAIIFSITLVIYSIKEALSHPDWRNRTALAAAIIMALAVPLGIFGLGPLIANGAVRIQAPRTAPLADFQIWAIHLLDTTDPNSNAGIYFSGDDPKIPVNLRPFTKHFEIVVGGIGPHVGATTHVDLVAGGGLLEPICHLSIGRPSYIPENASRAQKWADGIYFFYGR